MEACARRGLRAETVCECQWHPPIIDGKTHATEEKIMEREERFDEYERKENTARHVILSTTSIRLGAKIKNLKSARRCRRR